MKHKEDLLLGLAILSSLVVGFLYIFDPLNKEFTAIGVMFAILFSLGIAKRTLKEVKTVKLWSFMMMFSTFLYFLIKVKPLALF